MGCFLECNIFFFRPRRLKKRDEFLGEEVEAKLDPFH